MPKTFNFTLTSKKEGNQIPISATFEDEELARFAEFYQYGEELWDVKLMKDGIPCSLNMSYSAGLGTSFVTKLPPDEDVIVFLHKLRPFILKSEPTSYYNVASILGKRLDHTGIRAFLRSQRELYDGRSFQNELEIKFTDAGKPPITVNSEKVLFDWLNARHYHRAADAKAAIEALHALLPEEAARVIFLSTLSGMALAIVNLAQFLGLFIGKGTSVNLRP